MSVHGKSENSSAVSVRSDKGTARGLVIRPVSCKVTINPAGDQIFLINIYMRSSCVDPCDAFRFSCSVFHLLNLKLNEIQMKFSTLYPSNFICTLCKLVFPFFLYQLILHVDL